VGAIAIGALLFVLMLGGCGDSGVTAPDEGHLPQTAAERDAADVVRAYDVAIRRGDAGGVCRIVGGEELEVFRCRTGPSVPADRRARLTSPGEIRIDATDSPTGWIFLSGSAHESDKALFFKVSTARGALRVTRVRLGYRI
jgi:hypothetical protein